MINLFCIRWKKEAYSSVVKNRNGCGGVIVLVLDRTMFEVFARVSSLSSSTLLAKTAVSSLILILA